MASTLASAFYAKGKVVLVQPLGGTVRLGSVGYLNDEQWIEVSTTKKMFGLDLAIAAGNSEPNTFDGKSGKDLKFETHAQGEISALVPKLGDAQARAEITFGSQGSFVMSVRDQTVSQAGELAELMSAIRYAYRNRKSLPEGERWEQKYAVVVGLASAASVTALSSESRNATAIISGSAKAAAPASPADIDASMKVSFAKDSVDKLWRGPAAGYAFQALAIRPSLFKTWDREDVEFIKPKGVGLVARAPAPAGKPKRPASYVSWAERSQVRVPAEAAELLTPAGKTAGPLLLPARRKAAKKASPSAKKAPPRTKKSKSKRSRT